MGLAALVLLPGCSKSDASVAPTITAQPANVTVTAGALATFSAAASGKPAPTCQWQRTQTGIWADLPSATSWAYAFTTVQADEGAQFRLVASNSAGTAISQAAILTVIPAVPVITASPASLSVAVGQTATFTVVASGDGTLIYLWERSNDAGASWAAVTAGTGAGTSTYVTAATVLADSGAQFRALVINAGGTATSAAATLMVTAAAGP